MKKVAVIPDTNIFIHDPNTIENLRQKNFFIYLPWILILELDRLKSKPDVGIDAREALRNIEGALQEKNEHLMVIRRPSFKNLNELSKDNPDHKVIATAKTVKDQYGRHHEEVKIISRDRPVRILANELGILAENYDSERVESFSESTLKTINVDKEDIKGDTIPLQKKHLKNGDIVENEGVVCYSNYDPFFRLKKRDWGESFAAVRKKGSLLLIPNDISALGVTPFSLDNNGYNWHQHIALFHLFDHSIALIFLLGGAGSGKTMLTLAAASCQRKEFRKIFVTRPMVPLEDEDRLGFAPGDIKEKMSPWLQPIWQNLAFLKEQRPDNKKLIERMIDTHKIDFVPLDHIRGSSFYKNLLIVDDAQNLTPHQMKTIITRPGFDTKVIFTGDLGQIDRKRRLDRRSSGLAYASERLSNHPLVAVTRFKETVRSALASLAEERL